MKEKDLIEIITTEGEETVIAAVNEFSRKRYIDGQKSLAKLVRDMRFKQKDYARDQSNLTLKASQKLEKQVDRTVEVILK